jgi:hypothetical protein
MELVALVEPSKGLDLGHMVIGQELDDGASSYFGFRFDPADLPEEYRDPKRWQEYLYSNRILGSIDDDTHLVEKMRREKPDDLVEKRLGCDLPLAPYIPAPELWKHCAFYSFRPDDFHSDEEPCYNCVTWATMIGNKVVPGFLAPVRQGQIKLMLRQLAAANSNTGETDG